MRPPSAFSPLDRRILLPALIGLACAWTFPVRADTKDSCVWKVTGENGAVAYLAGSIHMLRPEDHPLPPTYDVAYEKSDTVYFEVDVQNMTSMQARVLEMSKLPDGQRVEDVVSEQTYTKLQDYFEMRGIGGEIFETMHPGMLAMTIGSLEAIQIGALPQFGVEMIYDRRARADDKPVKALETIEYQIGLFNDELTGEQQEALLAETLDETENTSTVQTGLIDAWKAGDTDRLAELLHEEFDERPRLTELVLHQRNRNWIEPIEEEMRDADSTPVFIVGAGHLAGDESVIELLEEQGYRLRQLTYED